MSRWLVAPQEFKGTLTATEAATALAEGLRQGAPGVELDVAPLADGGPGTVDALLTGVGGERVVRTVTGPLGQPVRATYGVLDGGRTAVIEMAAASGLSLLAAGERDARRASTTGTGELMRDALERGCQRLILGLGGSATTDGGSGALTALGWRFLDASGTPLPLGGAALQRLARVDASGAHPRLAEVELLVATDVTSPLLGADGAARLFGPQKGADAAAVEELEAALAHFAEVLSPGLAQTSGGGAAGGFGYGLVALARGRIVSGYTLVARTLRLSERLAAAQAVLTGEGRFDRQTALGKGPGALAKEARALGRRTVMFAGQVTPDASAEGSPFDEVIDLSARKDSETSAAESLRQAGARWAAHHARTP
ncbi:Glycerate kinase [Cystobacter fuscus DSM 2262]|uniref:Glycerate kinase n=1 Tax=Cystobacter fuscus (strain ATCC 25194 / DSM 2262 / NBRC 100088 / M29) TaxID=1242864 RepID=S9PEX7_CYSF2|nr:glycerate kinase [Cystobacter fuscus]EPX62945.1 Glycerate kinase [Cystobacter fuscus DSM 2262]